MAASPACQQFYLMQGSMQRVSGPKSDANVADLDLNVFSGVWSVVKHLRAWELNSPSHHRSQTRLFASVLYKTSQASSVRCYAQMPCSALYVLDRIHLSQLRCRRDSVGVDGRRSDTAMP